jgi:hypothetical protein
MMMRHFQWNSATPAQALARLQEIQRERGAILAAFPDLRIASRRHRAGRRADLVGRGIRALVSYVPRARICKTEPAHGPSRSEPEED